VLKKIPRTPLDFCSGGVTCGFSFGVRSYVSLASEVDAIFIVGLVCAYNLALDFVFNGGVEESSMVCRRLESILLLFLEATMVIMFLLVAIESLLKILS